MSISRLAGFVVLGCFLSACSGAGVMGTNGHANAAPARPLNATATASHGVQPKFSAKQPCIYVSDHHTGDVRVYNGVGKPIGDFNVSTYGWGILATSTAIYIGKNDGSGSLDIYAPCSNSFVGSVTGLGKGGEPLGIAGFTAAGKPGYATDLFNGDIEYWATGTGTAVSRVDPNTPAPNYLDTDKQGDLWVIGWDTSFANEIVDKCNKTITTCTTMVTVVGGGVGGIQVVSYSTGYDVFVADEYGVLHHYNCSFTSCAPVDAYTYPGSGEALTGLALKWSSTSGYLLWYGVIFQCTSSTGLCSDAESIDLPLSSGGVGPSTPVWADAIIYGVARYKPDPP